MKKLLLLFCLVFSLGSIASAQDIKMFISPNWLSKKLPDQPKIDFRNHLFLNSQDTIRRDSVEVHFPKEFLLEREWNSSNLKFRTPNEASLPYYELPPSQSRMPIITFNDSVNYTILKKEFK